MLDIQRMALGPEHQRFSVLKSACKMSQQASRFAFVTSQMRARRQTREVLNTRKQTTYRRRSHAPTEETKLALGIRPREIRMDKRYNIV